MVSTKYCRSVQELIDIVQEKYPHLLSIYLVSGADIPLKAADTLFKPEYTEKVAQTDTRIEE